MKNRIAYFPIGLIGLIVLIDFGIVASAITVGLLSMWLWVGVKLTDRECEGLRRGLFYSWFWPVWVSRYGLFSKECYRVYLNGIAVGSLGAGDLTRIYRSNLLSVENWLAQVAQWILALFAALIITAALGSTILFWAGVVVGKVDANLLVEFVKTWLDTGVVPFKKDILLIGKGIASAVFLLIARNILNERIGFSLRQYFNQPSLGYIRIEPIL